MRMIVFVVMLAAAPLLGQTGKLDLRFDHLAAKAEESVDVNLDGAVLKLAVQFLSSRDEDQRRIKAAVAGLTGIYVRSFEFDEEGAYGRAEVEKVRSQMDSSWQRVVTVRERNGDDVDVFVRPGETTTNGIVIIAAEPKEFTVVQLVGTIDLAQLAELEGEFGIPRVKIRK